MSPMFGAIVFLIVLVIVMPVAILMSFAGLAAAIGYLTKSAVDADNVESELLAVAQANPWAHTDTTTNEY
ncbi:MAG: hypothetical protein V3V01_02190 [Acidimicrobiales bacterium]